MEVEIKDVVALTGSPGLYRIVKADDQAIVVESLDEKKKRQLIKGNMLISKLTDISIYTEEDSEPLVHVLQNVQSTYGSDVPVTKKSSKADLFEFMESVLPSFDRERVYPSNVKKLISWYKILLNFDVSFELEEESEASEAEQADSSEEEASEEAPREEANKEEAKE